jgi:hypothetical protein
MSKDKYYVLAFWTVPKDTGRTTLPSAWMTRPPNPYKGVSGGLQQIFVEPHLVESIGEDNVG